MLVSRKVLSESGMLNWLNTLGEVFPPISVESVTTLPGTQQNQPDALLEISWSGNRFRFAVESSTAFNPKAIAQHIERAVRHGQTCQAEPMLLVPYLSEDRLQELSQSGISGVDLCGNGVITVPGQLFVYRTGYPNWYPSSAPIKNVYQGISSLVARAFLLRPEYASTQELMEEINSRGAEITLPTVSKVCKTLADELMIERTRKGRKTRLRLLQPGPLLGRLAGEYEGPMVTRRFLGNQVWGTAHGDDWPTFERCLAMFNATRGRQIVMTGISSCRYYATMAQGGVCSYYCADLGALLTKLGRTLEEDEYFPTLELLETDDPRVYFDARDGLVASPVQTYLELMQGDKREQETASQVRELLLRQIEQQEQV